ncbi:relaxase/mobilization nuclease domain-containing protein [Streptomyces sp. NPDC006863]|uniref:relaxase/mobilization nuclease domain-containing protein n=1 Tax=Streptomyces sp. NPDC006863 TaxID=3154779 RepID=UPI0033CAFDD3
MIPRIHKRGSATVGLIRYLYGPGTHEEHIDPHLVAAFDPLMPDPGRDPQATCGQLQRLLDQPVNALPAGRRPDKHVWHLSVSASPEDPVLPDDAWAAIARRMVAATGIDPEGDDAACRWAAVRHADDHIHIIATLVRDDGRRPRLHNEARRAQAEARLIEADYGLRRVTPGDGTAAKRPTSAERHKAERRGRQRTPREELREAVRRSVAGAGGEEEFFDRLAGAGLLVRRRVAPSGDTLGYTIALPGDRNAKGQPVFYSGSKLAPDLSLPRIRERWDGNPDHPAQQSALPSATGPASARRGVTSAAWHGLFVVDHGEDGAVAAQIAATGEVLDALAQTSAAHTRHELQSAAAAFERASRSHVRAARGHDHALRQAARDLVQSGPAFGRGEDGAATAMAIDMLIFLVSAAAHWHAGKQHAQQAEAAHRAAEHLRLAYRTAAERPMAVLHQRGVRMAPSQQHRHAALVRQALPELADRIIAEPGWHALVTTLDEVQAAGHNPTALLTEAAARRELDTAAHMSDVLVWRLRRSAVLPADPPQLQVPPAGGKRPVAPPERLARIEARPANSSPRRR